MPAVNLTQITPAAPFLLTGISERLKLILFLLLPLSVTTLASVGFVALEPASALLPEMAISIVSCVSDVALFSAVAVPASAPLPLLISIMLTSLSSAFNFVAAVNFFVTINSVFSTFLPRPFAVINNKSLLPALLQS